MGRDHAVLRRRGLPWWRATISALPVLFDVLELQLEHMVAADVPSTPLSPLVLVLLCWWDRPPLWVAVLVGLATGYATTVRTVGSRCCGGDRHAAAEDGLAPYRCHRCGRGLPILGYVIWFTRIPGITRSTSRTALPLQPGADPSPTATGWTRRPSCGCSATRARWRMARRPRSTWSDRHPLSTLTGRNNGNGSLRRSTR